MKSNKTTEQQTIKIDSLSILRATAYKSNKSTVVFFDMVLNGVSIYGCRVVEGKNGDFIAFPSTKAKDGKYYNVCYADFSNEDSKMILDKVQWILDN